VSPSQKPKSKPAAKRKPPPSLGTSRTAPWVRVTIILIVIALGLGSVAALLFRDDSSGSSSGSNTDQTTTTSTAAALASVAGKPCVAVADALPAGAPQVPVEVGAPPTTLVTKDLTVGTGATVAAGDTITVDYIGVACSSGKIFDASYGSQPVTFPLSGVIPGWQNGIPGMKVGGVRLLGIPPDQAYGSQGSPPDIAPDETLWFVVTVNSATPASATTPST
jgi:peptidylprolyl isomerase